MKVEIKVDGETKVNMESDLCYFSAHDKNKPSHMACGIVGENLGIENLCSQLATSLVGIIKNIEDNSTLQNAIAANIMAKMIEELAPEYLEEEVRAK
jgi:ribosomal protein L11 methylase PrmA